MTHVWRWRTVSNPWAPPGAPRVPHPLAHRFGDPCRIAIPPASNGNILVVFDDGEWTVCPRYAVRRA